MEEIFSIAPIQLVMRRGKEGRRGEEGRRGTRELGHITQETEDHHSEMKLKLQ